MQRIATDILGELPETENGNKYILVVSDYFTKWTEAFAMANMEAGTVARIIVEEVVTRFGVPMSSIQIRGDSMKVGCFRKCAKCWVQPKQGRHHTIQNPMVWLSALTGHWKQC